MMGVTSLPLSEKFLVYRWVYVWKVIMRIVNSHNGYYVKTLRYWLHANATPLCLASIALTHWQWHVGSKRAQHCRNRLEISNLR